MTKITDLEKAVLISIVENEYTGLNGGIPETYDDIADGTWANCIDCGPSDIDCPTGKTLSGVVSSLSKKNLLVSEYGGKDSAICLTEEGFEVYKTFGRK